VLLLLLLMVVVVDDIWHLIMTAIICIGIVGGNLSINIHIHSVHIRTCDSRWHDQ